MKYAFVAEHRPLFSVRAMCRCLRIHPSGFLAWLKNPLSRRTKEDVRQTELIRRAWTDSGKVYWYRKLHDDLLDQGEICCPKRKHVRNGMLTPVEFERQQAMRTEGV